jgi:hypothetical protein
MYRSLLLISALIFTTACSALTLPFGQPSPAPIRPQVLITTPGSGAQFTVGTEVIIQSISSDTNGIARVELLVDNQIVRSDATPTGQTQLQFPVAQTWRAIIPGTHIVVVRATNQKGATGESALSITINEPPKPPTLPIPTAMPTRPPATPMPTNTRVPPTIPSDSQRTLTLTEAQVNAAINAAIASGQIEYITSATVSLQNGQIIIMATYTPPGLTPISGRIILSANASNCALHLTVIQANLGIITLNDAQKATLGQSIEQILKRQLPQQTYCVDSVTIATGVMTIKYH